MQREIKFKKTGSNSIYGSFAAGDIMRCDQALAEHYVKEGVAVYSPSPVPDAPSEILTPARDAKPRGKRAK